MAMKLSIDESNANDMQILVNGMIFAALRNVCENLLTKPSGVDLEDEDDLSGPHILTFASGVQLRIIVQVKK